MLEDCQGQQVWLALLEGSVTIKISATAAQQNMEDGMLVHVVSIRRSTAYMNVAGGAVKLAKPHRSNV